MGAIRDIVTKFSFKTDKGVLKSVDKTTAKITKNIKRQRYEAMRLNRTMARFRNQVLGAAAAYMGLRAMRSLTVGLVNEISDLTTNAMMLGVSAKQLDALRVAFESLTLDGTKADNMLRLFVQGIADAQRGTGMAAEGLQKLGISAESLKKLTAAEQLNIVLNKLKTVGSDSERMMVAGMIAGRRGGLFLATLAKKYDHVKKAIDGADKAGVLFGKNHRVFDDAAGHIAVLKRQWRDIRIQLGVTLVRTLLPLMKAFQKWMSDAKNRKALVSAIKQIAAAVALLATSKVISSVIKLAKSLKILALGVLVKLGTALRVVGVALKALGAVFSATGAVVTAFLAVVGVWAYVFIFRTKETFARIREAWQGFKLMVHDIGSAIVRIWDATVGRILAGVDKITAGLKKAGSAIQKAYGWTKGKVSGAISGLGKIVGVTGGSETGSGIGTALAPSRAVGQVTKSIAVGQVHVQISGQGTTGTPAQIGKAVKTGVESGLGRVIATAGGAA